VGLEIMSTLTKEIEKYENIKVHLNTKVSSLIFDKRVKGVKYVENGEEKELLSHSVILATGGFSSSNELLSKYSPEFKDFPTTNGAWANGDGISLGEEVNAQLIDMDQVQIHPTGLKNKLTTKKVF
jgi:succinate dehydrogenase/fumarate reductase flavoprotein subunit